MKSLQIRITLSILFVVLIVTTLVGAALYQRLDKQNHQEFRSTVRAVQESVTARLERDAASLELRITALKDDAAFQRLAADLREGVWDTQPAARHRLRTAIAGVMKSASLDVLWVLDNHRGNAILAAPHRLGDLGLPSEVAAYLENGLSSFVVVRELISRHDRIVELVTLESGVRSGRLTLVGGIVVGSGMAAELQAGLTSQPRIDVRDGQGQLLAQADSPLDMSSIQQAQVVHQNPGDTRAALVVDVILSQARMKIQARELMITLISILGFGVLFGLFLGRILAKRITNPLRRLVAASRFIGAGQRDIDLPTPGSDEVGELVQAFGRMQQELDTNDARLRRAERVAAWQDIARELAHEIKNPLTPIQMAIETLRRAHSRKHERFDELFNESSETILEEVARLSKIVTQFSQFARMPKPEPRQYPLNDVVRSVAILYRDHPVRVTDSLDTTVGDIFIDPERMTQVVQNLVLNAVQAVEGIDRQGHIQLRTLRTSHDTVELVVEDNGPGIAPDDMPRVFTPYFTSKTGGTGLGLAVVHRIVSGHNGRIGVQSEVGRGTHFIVQLPG